MLRRLFNIATFASLLLCVATAGLWVRSRWTSDTITVRSSWSYGGGPRTKWVVLRTRDGLDEQWVRIHCGERPARRRQCKQRYGVVDPRHPVQSQQGEGEHGKASEHRVPASDAHADPPRGQRADYSPHRPGDEAGRDILRPQWHVAGREAAIGTALP